MSTHTAPAPYVEEILAHLNYDARLSDDVALKAMSGIERELCKPEKAEYENIRDLWPKSIESELSWAIDGLFIFKGTPEGEDFWRSLQKLNY